MWCALFRIQHTRFETTETEQHSMDMLKNDLRAIQGGIREVLGASGGRLSVPSWKFPSKQAVEVDIDEVLKNCASSTCTAEGEDVGHVQQLYLLELIVDRYAYTRDTLVCVKCPCIHKSLISLNPYSIESD